MAPTFVYKVIFNINYPLIYFDKQFIKYVKKVLKDDEVGNNQLYSSKWSYVVKKNDSEGNREEVSKMLLHYGQTLQGDYIFPERKKRERVSSFAVCQLENYTSQHFSPFTFQVSHNHKRVSEWDMEHGREAAVNQWLVVTSMLTHVTGVM